MNGTPHADIDPAEQDRLAQEELVKMILYSRVMLAKYLNDSRVHVFPVDPIVTRIKRADKTKRGHRANEGRLSLRVPDELARGLKSKKEGRPLVLIVEIPGDVIAEEESPIVRPS